MTPAGTGQLPVRERVAEFDAIGVTAFTTTRAHGDFSLSSPEAQQENSRRWHELHGSLAPAVSGLASAHQVHGVAIAEHAAPWDGWMRLDGVDAHLVLARRSAAAVTVADCVPVFIAHPAGTVAVVHAGWRGTAARLLERVAAKLGAAGVSAHELHVHLGPAICGRCYEVGPDVYEQLTGWQTIRHRHVDLRALLAEQAKGAGVRDLTVSAYCTRCDNDRFFSHRAGDSGRQISVIASPAV
jgi:YfiH family protein